MQMEEQEKTATEDDAPQERNEDRELHLELLAEMRFG